MVMLVLGGPAYDGNSRFRRGFLAENVGVSQMSWSVVRTVIAAAVVSVSLQMPVQAASLGELLGARAAARQASKVTNSPTRVSTPQVVTPADDGVASLGQASPRLPILRKLIKLYILYLLYNPYR